MGLVVLVGVSGSGKCTFAAQHFTPWQVISSDYCRGLVADDENDQAATRDAFDVLQYIVGTRLRRGLLTVVDATNVQGRPAQALVKLAREHDVLVDAIVLDVPEARRLRAQRRPAGPRVRRQWSPVSTATSSSRCAASARRGSGGSTCCAVSTRSRPPRSRTERPWNDRRDVTGPFDIVGDVHGCAIRAAHPAHRARLAAVVRRGPARRRRDPPRGPHRACSSATSSTAARTRPGVLRLVMGMVAAGTALCVSGNHEAKLVRALKGAKVRSRHGLAESLAQLDEETEEFRAEALAFMDGLISHFVLDDGRLVVAHAGLKEAYHGRSLGPGPLVRAVRRHDRRDRRVRPAGPLPVGPRVPRPGDGRLRPHPGPRGRVDQQHDLPRHRRASSAAS